LHLHWRANRLKVAGRGHNVGGLLGLGYASAEDFKNRGKNMRLMKNCGVMPLRPGARP